MKSKGKLIILSGPSGVGKGTLCRIAKKEIPEIFISVSMTERTIRPREKNHEHYHFVSKEEFDRMVSEFGLLEYATYGENRYGTPKEPVEKAINEGRPVILEIEVDGALQVKEKCPEAIMVFVKPPSIKALEARLYRRSSETPQQIAKRIKRAEYEFTKIPQYDYVIVNDILKNATKEFVSIIKGEK